MCIRSISWIFYSPHWNLLSWLAVLTTFAGLTLLSWAAAKDLAVIGDPSLRYAVSFLLVLTSCLALLSCATFLRERLHIRQEGARARQILNLQSLLAQFAVSGNLTEELTAAAAACPHEFLAVAGESIDVLKGSQRERLRDLCLRLHPFLLKQVRGWNLNRAIRAISLLGKLDSPQTRDAFQDALYHPFKGCVWKSAGRS